MFFCTIPVDFNSSTYLPNLPNTTIVICKPLTLQNVLLFRGSGASSSDDYHNPHTVVNATEDVLTLVQSVCTGNVRGPGLVVAYGTLGEAIARCYTTSLLDLGGVTQHIHSEVSGKGAIKPPFVVLLVPDSAKNIHHFGPDGETLVRTYEFEDDVSSALLASAKEYLDAKENSLEALGLTGPAAPVKIEWYVRDSQSTQALYALSTENPHYSIF